jgi:hypothetical protein
MYNKTYRVKSGGPNPSYESFIMPTVSKMPAISARVATVVISPDTDPWHGELRNTINHCITTCYGIYCHNSAQADIVAYILEAKGLKLAAGIQPAEYQHIRIHEDRTYSRVWQLLNPRKITFDEFIK